MTEIATRPAVSDVAGKSPQTSSAMTMVEAINRALHDSMADDERVLVFGEDVAVQGGVFRVTEGLLEAFGEQRCFDTPLAESALVGISVGLALRGFVPVPEIQFDGFSYPAFDQIVSHLAKFRLRTHGEVSMPVTIRIPSFGGIGAAEHHSESTESYWVHTAGLMVVAPATPTDAYWLLRHAIASPDPVIYLEPKRRYWGREVVDRSVVAPPIGQAVVRREGTDVTVLTYAGLVGTALSAADVAAEQHGWSLEIVDLRSLSPLDFETVATSIRKLDGASSCMRAPAPWGSARSWPPASSKSCSTSSRHLCYGPRASTLRIHRRGWRSSGFLGPTDYWTASNARWSSREWARGQRVSPTRSR